MVEIEIGALRDSASLAGSTILGAEIPEPSIPLLRPQGFRCGQTGRSGSSVSDAVSALSSLVKATLKLELRLGERC